MVAHRTTLARFLIEQRSHHPGASGELNAVILDVALVCKAISKRIAYGALGGVLGAEPTTNVQGETQQKLDVLANEVFLKVNERSGLLAGMVSEELDDPHPIPPQYPRGKYLLVFDPLDGSSNIDVNVSVGSIFSVLRAPEPGRDAVAADFLQPGSRQVCAGYAIYGPSTVLVLSVGTGVHAFTLDPELGEFLLTRRDLAIPETASEFAINASNRRFWEPPVRRYVDECLAGRSGPRGKDYNMRWVASAVAELHRILTRGGVFLYPRDTKDPARAGRLRLLYEASPIAFLVEQAGGRAGTGRHRILDVLPEGLHQRIPLVFGARDEVERIEQMYAGDPDAHSRPPLFGNRGLFRAGT
ncbi:MAG: class 1 fructose-bisphosphatase [Pseudonocardia sp.]|nr:class 1 fructose-bisphosphatase [Pseudonocardia sp.]